MRLFLIYSSEIDNMRSSKRHVLYFRKSSCSQMYKPSKIMLAALNKEANLRWPNTVFARAFADAIQRAHKDCKKQTCRQ